MATAKRIMGKIKYIIFDFDGTIADTIDLAINIYNGISSEYSSKPVREEDRKLLRKSRPHELLKQHGVSNLKLLRILLRVRKEMNNLVHGLMPVKNITDSLREIRNEGFQLGILTSNSEKNVREFLADNGLSEMIDFIYSGKSLFGKDKVLQRLFDNEKISGESVIYVGDETRDIEASRKAGIPVIAVTWGLNNKDVLSAMNPDQIADTPKDLLRCVYRIMTD